MKLRLYSSIGQETPNLVSLQAEDLDYLPTVLVCPIKEGVPETVVRAQFVWQGTTFTALWGLVRPIRRQALRPIAWLDENTSHLVMQRFLRLLAK